MSLVKDVLGSLIVSVDEVAEIFGPWRASL